MNEEGQSRMDFEIVIKEYYEALNVMFTGDYLPMANMWQHADDVIYMSPDGQTMVGWDNVLSNWQAQASLNLGGHVEPEGIHNIIGKNIGISMCTEVGKNKDIEGFETTVSLRVTNVFRYVEGAWKVIAHHSDVLPFLKLLMT